MELNIKKEFEFKIKISSKLNFEWGKGKTYSKNSVKTTFTVFFDSFQVYVSFDFKFFILNEIDYYLNNELV